MVFTQVRTYVKGVIRKAFVNKNVLDQFSYDIDEGLLYDGNPLSSTETVSSDALSAAIDADAAELSTYPNNSSEDDSNSGG